MTEVKVCPKCRAKVPAAEWPVSRRHPPAPTKRCAPCLDKLKEDSRKWKAANPEKERERKRRWKAENPEKNREYNRNWSKANRLRITAEREELARLRALLAEREGGRNDQ